MNYTFSEYCDMHLILGACKGNSTLAAREYATRFPNRRHPDGNVIRRLENRLRQTGSLVSLERISKKIKRLKRPISRLKDEIAMENESLQIKNQEIKSDRYEFCQWILRQQITNENFLSEILWSDVNYFTYKETCNDFLSEEKGIFVWAGLLGDNLLGPYLFLKKYDHQTYKEFLQNILPELLENVILSVRLRLWFQHDDASEHQEKKIRRHLNNVFSEKWIGPGGPVHWPSCSNDLHPLKFFLWEELNKFVYEETPKTIEDLEARLYKAYMKINANALQNLPRIMLQRAASCIEAKGDYFDPTFLGNE